MATQLSEFIWANHPGVRCSNPKHLFHLKSNFVLYLLFIVLRKGRKEQLKDHKHNYYFDHTQPFTAEFEFVFAQSFAERVDCCWLLLLLSLVALLLLTMLSSWSLFTQATIYELKYWVEPPPSPSPYLSWNLKLKISVIGWMFGRGVGGRSRGCRFDYQSGIISCLNLKLHLPISKLIHLSYQTLNCNIYFHRIKCEKCLPHYLGEIYVNKF